MGVVSRRQVWLVEVSGIYWYVQWVGCKEVYIERDFLILLIPTPFVSVLFLQQHP